MDNNSPSEERSGELEKLLARVPPPRAPGWFVARTMARCRAERDAKKDSLISRIFVWRWAGFAVAMMVFALGWVRWEERPGQKSEVSDAAVFAALDALVEQDEENRWWAGL